MPDISLTSRSVLPHDTYGRDLGLFIGHKLPFILGTNIAGIVEKLGPGVTSYVVGDHVFGLGSPNVLTPDRSGLQEYTLMDAESLGKVPAGFTFDEIVTFPVNSLTSFAALFHSNGFGFPPPTEAGESTSKSLLSETILVIGGGSNVGKLAIQLAKLAGVGRIITIASAANTETLQKLGATHIVDRHQTEELVAKQIQEIVGPDGVPKIYDCVSWDYTFPISLLSPSKPSVLLTLHPCEAAQEIVKGKGINSRVTFIFGTSDFLQPMTKSFWEALPGWIEKGFLAVSKYRVVEGFDLKLIEEGLDSYRDGKPVTPFIIHPQGK